MAVVNGNSIIIYIGNTAVGSQRGVTFDSSAEMLDISDKTSADAKFISGKRTDTVTLSSFYLAAGDAPQAALRTAYEAGSSVEVDWVESSTDGLTGTGLRTAENAFISSLSVNAPEHGPAETEVTLQITGGWGTYSV